MHEGQVMVGSFAVLHTSASLTINENASPDVPLDLADALDRLAPEGTEQKYRHDDEGWAFLSLCFSSGCSCMNNRD
jgi:thiamine phosphate synthase YjbQ (UPF0047 family)